MSEKWVEKARPSLAHQADKFNTEAPAGYVAGRRTHLGLHTSVRM